MAYLKSYTKKCYMFLCEKKATHELMNTCNASCGFYCAYHANRELKLMTDDENRTR